MEFKVNINDLALEAIILIRASNRNVSISLSNETCLSVSDSTQFTSNISAMRYLANTDNNYKWMGSDALERCEINHWITYSIGTLSNIENFDDSIKYLDKIIAPITYLVGNKCSLADIVVWSTLFTMPKWIDILQANKTPINITRWYSFIASLDYVKEALTYVGQLTNDVPPVRNVKRKEESSPVIENRRKDEGKFIDLPGAVMGEVVVRFPPEASGYLHIGHAKAALLNQYYKDAFNGKLIMRFDDTNPAKEKEDFERVILEDLKLLQINYDVLSRTSNYFDKMLEMCEKLIKSGLAYVDDTDAEEMKKEREKKICSKNRNNNVEKNMSMWNEMKLGTEKGQKCCVRVKIDMESLNGCMRDPTIYRCKNESHPQTGNKYKVYPTYDFACPIVDSLEGVTHCLRSMEYRDRDEQFNWFIDALGLRKPNIWEYSRLNMTNTVLSKRKLTWFVENDYVNGWDDPRMPTVRGILRRGMTVEGLKQFISAQGSSRSVVLMEWDKIWAINKKVIDPIAPRYTAIDAIKKIHVQINDITPSTQQVPKHPKNESVGMKNIWLSPDIFIDEIDAVGFEEKEKVTFINWGNIIIDKIDKKDNKIVNIVAKSMLDDCDYKKTKKITWLASVEKNPLIPVICYYFDHIISKAILGKDEDFKQYINHDSMFKEELLGEPELIDVKKSDIIQLQRKGFFICEQPYLKRDYYTFQSSPLVLIYIPDGHSKSLPNDLTPVRRSVTNSTNNTLSNSIEQFSKQQNIINDLKKDESKVDTLQLETETQKLMELKEICERLYKGELELLPSKMEKRTDTEQKDDNNDVNKILSEITTVGDKIRKLKSDKADKSIIQENVNKLLELKTTFKEVTGKEWKPGLAAVTVVAKQEPTKTLTGSQDIHLDANELSLKITDVGNKVRKMKGDKVSKECIDQEVKSLIKLKSDYKSLTGHEWKPLTDSNATTTSNATSDISQLLKDINEVGNKIRQLKSDKVDKNLIDEEVKVLLQLKNNYKNITGKDWNPNLNKVPDNSKSEELFNRIQDQSDKVTAFKSYKIEENIVDAEIKILLDLKAEYKSITGKDWNPDKKTSEEESVGVCEKGSTDSVDQLTSKIKEQGNAVRKMKQQTTTDKNELNQAIDKLLKLKTEYKELTGKEFPSEGSKGQSSNKKVSKNDEKLSKVKASSKQDNKSGDNESSSLKKVTRLGLEAKKEENLSDWYSQIIVKSELIEYYDISGCYILRPWSYAIWESIKEFLDSKIKELGVKNCYFPIFVSKAVLEKEKTHIADFAPEVAWVTKSGDSDLAEPIAVRPTSETVMYPAYAKWIQSYRDLPIKLNQWNNVVRWEFKHPQPFLRTREFLWQEGHTAFATYGEAETEVYQILEFYASVYKDLLAVPVVKGRKTDKEKFAGGDYTLTVEVLVSASGRAIQGGTSHHLGQNFSKMFEIIYEDPITQEKKFVYQNSWGITTRTIGVLIMVHADNQGLVLPPRVASVQVIIIPCGITANLKQSDKEQLLAMCNRTFKLLKEHKIRCELDDRDNYSPGWKFNHWELKGVPIRIEIGPKDMQQKQIVAVRRDNGQKLTIPFDNISIEILKLLDNIQCDMLLKATNELKQHMIICKNWNIFCQELDKKNILLSPYCGRTECEDKIKEESTRNDPDIDINAPSMGAKSLCIPFEQPAPITDKDGCIHPGCTAKPQYYCLFGRSY